MSDKHDHSHDSKEKLCCDADFLQQGIENSLNRIDEKKSGNTRALYSTEGSYEDILANYLKNRQNRLHEINEANGSSWIQLEKAFATLQSKGFQIGRYMQIHDPDMAESLVLMTTPGCKTFAVYSTYDIFDEQKRFNLQLYAAEQPIDAFYKGCSCLSSKTDGALFDEVISVLNQSNLKAEIGDFPGIIAITGEWPKIDYSEIDNSDLDFHLEVRVALNQEPFDEEE
ncbi:MAG: hypothetical protein IPG59_08210 [Candidatus Melainabacteria bacterium]|nr:MAG: hypothetical protein IPG59_08210 [Candidatus Melainabacteria bacterium]